MQKVTQNCFCVFWGFLLVVVNAEELNVISSVEAFLFDNPAL